LSEFIGTIVRCRYYSVAYIFIYKPNFHVPQEAALRGLSNSFVCHIRAHYLKAIKVEQNEIDVFFT